MSDILDTKELKSLEVNGIGLVEQGLKVEHPSLGLGVVENIYQTISSSEVNLKIKFNDYGSRNINPKSAHLSLIVKPDNGSFVLGVLKALIPW